MENQFSPTLIWENESLTTEHHDSLITHLRSHQGDEKSKLHAFFKSSWGDNIKSNGYCGAISVNGKSYSILPKIEEKKDAHINTKYMTYMFLKAHGIKIKHEDISNNMKNVKLTIFDILIDIFASKLIDELSQGICRDYICERNNINKIRGRWLIREHVTTNFFNERAVCEYDEFSENNKLNKFFLFASKILSPNDKNIRKKLRMIEQALEDVEYEQIDIWRFNMSFNRMNRRFRESYELGMLLLKHLVTDFSGPGRESFIFLFKMDEVFEMFIGNLIKELETEMKNDLIVKTQYSMYKKDNDLNIRPDIVIRSQDNPEKAALIIDTKYKIFEGRPSSGDKYQMYAYGMCYNFPEDENDDEGKRKVLLLYPQHNRRKLDAKSFKLEGQASNSKVVLDVEEINVKMEDEQDFGYEDYVDNMKTKLIEKLNKYSLFKGN